MKKKFVLFSLLLMASSGAFAQTNARTDINTMITNVILPVFGLGMLAGFLGLLWHNFEGLRGKNGLSKQDAWLSVGEGMVYVFLGSSLLSAVAVKLSSMNVSL